MSLSHFTLFFNIRFTAEKGTFLGGELRLVCAATIDDVWNTHVEAVAMGDNNDNKSNRRRGAKSTSDRRQEPNKPKHLLVANDGELSVSPSLDICTGMF